MFTTIILDNGAHVQKEVSYIFPHHIQWWVNICINRDNFQTLVDVVITNPTCPHMVLHASSTIAHATTVATQEKTCSYVKCALLHSPCHKDLWLSSYSFCFIFYYLCAGHYSMSSTTLFSSHDVYFLLSTTCLHSPPTCTSSSVLPCLGNIPHLFHTL
jgi:hypothetical protein